MRILLDQGFPVPPGFNPTDLDAAMDYQSLNTFDPRLSKHSTPDWMVILSAALGNFDAFVVDDQNLRDDDDSLIALALTDLSLITWTVGVDDAVTAWSQLVAYMPKIREKLSEVGPSIFVLPAIRLTKGDHVLKASDLVHKRAAQSGTTYREVRHRSTAMMREELRNRGRRDLVRLLR